MGLNLVYLGEHHVVDVFAGYALAGVVYMVTWRVSWRGRRSEGRTEEAGNWAEEMGQERRAA